MLVNRRLAGGWNLASTGYSGGEGAVIVGGATRARLVGGLIGPVGPPEACPCSFRRRASNEMGPSRSDRPIFQNTGNERKQGCKAPNWKARPCWEARSGASHHPHPECTIASGRLRNADSHPWASAGNNRGPPLRINNHITSRRQRS